MAKDLIMTNYKNPTHNASGTIDLEIEHPSLGWIPFTASPDDVEEHGRTLYALVKDEAAPYVEPEPTPAPVPQSVSRFQARAALLQAGLLPQAEAAISNAGELAQLAWADAQHFKRSSPLLTLMAIDLGLTADQLDDLFRAAALIEA